MCGIFGVWAKNPMSKNHSVEVINKAWKNLNDRGPDGHSSFYWSKSNSYSVFNNKDSYINFEPELIFTHNRLSIIDLSVNGTQPMSDKSKRYWLTYNGEIYNYKKLKVELEQSGIIFKSNSDTEVLIEGWAKWGPKIIDKINGMFAFAIYDTFKSELFLVRDRLGIKPMYYYTDSNYNIAFSSDQSTLMFCGIVNGQPNWEGVVSSMLFQTSIRPETVYKNIYAVEPGTYLKVTNNIIKKTEYWDLKNNINELTQSESIEKYESLLKSSITNCLVSDVEVASLMSGGVDSSTLSILSSFQNSDIKTYTLSWDSLISGNSELIHAKMNASRYGLNHYVCEINKFDIENNLEEMLSLFEEPIGLLEPHYPIAKTINSHKIKVVLNGLGPDEVLGGYDYYNMISRWKQLKKYKLLVNMLPLRNTKYYKHKNLSYCQNAADAYVELFSGYLWESPHELFNYDIIPKGWNKFEHVKALFPKAWTDYDDPVKTFNYLDTKIYIGSHHNHTSDRFLMKFNIEGRFPYLDHELYEYSFNLNSNLKINKSEQKWILKQISRKYIDVKILNSTKKGFSLNEKDMIHTPKNKDIFNYYLNSLSKRDIIKPNVIRETLLSSNLSRKHSQKLLYLLSFELWMRRLENNCKN